MNSQRKWLVGVIVLLVLMNITILAFFWSGKRPPNPNKITNHFVKELNLGETQAESFKTLFETHLEKSSQIMDSSRIYKERMFKMLVQPNRDEVALNKIIQQIGEFETQKGKLMIEHYTELENTCESEEQKEKLREIFIRSIPKPRGKPRRK